MMSSSLNHTSYLLNGLTFARILFGLCFEYTPEADQPTVSLKITVYFNCHVFLNLSNFYFCGSKICEKIS